MFGWIDAVGIVVAILIMFFIWTFGRYQLVQWTGIEGISKISQIGRYIISAISILMTYYSTSITIRQLLLTFHFNATASNILGVLAGLIFAFILEGYLIHSEKAIFESYTLGGYRILMYIVVYGLVSYVNYQTFIWSASVASEQMIDKNQVKIVQTSKKIDTDLEMLDEQLKENMRQQKNVRNGDYRAFLTGAYLRVEKNILKNQAIVDDEVLNKQTQAKNKWTRNHAKKKIDKAIADIQVLKTKKELLIAEAKEKAKRAKDAKLKELHSQYVEISKNKTRLRNENKNDIKEVANNIQNEAMKLKEEISTFALYLYFTTLMMSLFIAIESGNMQKIYAKLSEEASDKLKVLTTNREIEEKMREGAVSDIAPITEEEPKSYELEEVELRIPTQKEDTTSRSDNNGLNDKEDKWLNAMIKLIDNEAFVSQVFSEANIKKYKQSKKAKENFLNRRREYIYTDNPAGMFTVKDVTVAVKEMYKGETITASHLSNFIANRANEYLLNYLEEKQENVA